MTDGRQRKGKLTLSELAAIKIRDDLPVDTGAVGASTLTTMETEAAPETGRIAVDASEHAPDGVSPEVAALLGVPSREEAERAAAERAAAEEAARRAAAQAAERAAAEAAEAKAQAAAEQERIEAALAEARAVETARAASRRRATTVVGVAAGLGAAAAVAFWLSQQSAGTVDATPWGAGEVALLGVDSPESVVGFTPLPAPEPEVVEAPAPEPAAEPRRSSGSSRRSGGVDRGNLF